MAMGMQRRANVRLPPEVNRVLYIRNLPYKITGEEMYDIFGKYGAIRQIRVGNTPETKGTAFVVYEDIFDAKNACDHLSGFNVCNRYLVVLYYQPSKAFKKLDAEKKLDEIVKMKEKGIPHLIMSLVQYIILRKDLQTVLNWPLGALFAQTCHASTSVLHLFKDDPNTQNYLGDLDSMHKVVLQASDLEALTNLATKLREHKIDHKAWLEQPENILTCIALKPYPKDEVKEFVQQFKLYR
ncbi:Splicing factor 3B subunit 6 [Folsomia candida]|uniref:Splicing factor 3B subunit 6 n=1 Tax=Folsomia candida TaxID=158441 RepID=A0A226EPF5_FOLCA|nr:Splicing factor 3B subunit 6 [Folsomia candida]